MPPRKRKSRAPEVPEPVQLTEPEPAPEPEPEPAPEPEPEETQQALVVEEEEDPGVEDKAEEGNQDGEGEDDQQDDMEVLQNDAVSADPEKTEQESEIIEKPIENAVSENEGEAEGQNDEIEDELEEEPLEKLLEPFSKDQLILLIKESVSKHPDLVEDVHKLADSDPAHCKIFVFGLGWEANDETVTSVFGKYGEIVDCKVVKDKNTGKSKGYAFILFKHRNGARRALKQPQKMIEGRMTSCQLASAGPVQATPASNVVAAASSPPASEYTQKKIYVSNVSAELDPNKLLEFFSKFGEIEDGPLGLDKQTGKPRGFCLFVYKSVESAKKALEEPHKSFEGHMLHCQKAVDGHKHTKGHFNQQHSQPHQHHRQGYNHHPAKKGRYAGSSGGMSHTGGHLMAPSGVPSVGFNPAVAPAAIGQAVAALLATQGLGGYGGVNPQGVPPMMNNAGYGGHSGAGGYGGQPGMQGGYGGQPQMGQGGVRPYQGGPPYMGRGH